MMIRTRFAPSPTGYLHIGGARTALFCWLYAKRHAGQFLLRIEDTDRERSTQPAIDAILQAMDWLELHYDGEPIYQTARYDRYREIALQLVRDDKAYYCDCSKDRLEKLREQQLAEQLKPRYDGHCRERSLSASHPNTVIRFRNPDQGAVVFDDQVHGRIEIANQELDDLILIRSDGNPTYNFCVVIDDWDMKISHVIRGDDHINNTPRQINLFFALNATPPTYAHVPMILGPDGKRLSKRHGAVSVMQYREQGYLAQTMRNYLVRLGWSHGDQEIFTDAEMIALFDLEDINKAPASLNIEKLNWLNQHYLKTLPPQSLSDEFHYQLHRQNVPGPHRLTNMEAIITAQRERAKTLEEMVEKSHYFFVRPSNYDEKAIAKNITANTLTILAQFNTALSNLANWEKDSIHQLIESTALQHDIKMGQLAQPLRIAITGSTVSPPIDETILLIGKAEVVIRINLLLKHGNAAKPAGSE